MVKPTARGNEKKYLDDKGGYAEAVRDKQGD
jgi:hypothetical protein